MENTLSKDQEIEILKNMIDEQRKLVIILAEQVKTCMISGQDII